MTLTEIYSDVDTAIHIAVQRHIAGTVGVLLSGGVDSTVLLMYVLDELNPVPVVTIASDPSHPDLVAAQHVAAHFSLRHHVLLPGVDDVERARGIIASRRSVFPGDIGVYLALEYARSLGITRIIASDGIDELVGGYWWHANTSESFPTCEGAFAHFWHVLYPNHLRPMLQSAAGIGIDVRFPFLDYRVRSVLNRIPIDTRVAPGEPKLWWREYAKKKLGIPTTIADRRKLGFVSALDETVCMPQSVCGEVING
jgi:asparagine synthetase B (glutamine-hydrolysing)